ncbi:YIP1 family protein [Rossellomorea sp. SC111]|uniref:YIP1 family protein n=1 Tax=Rossellomorea sp. SC111 TaxID=2968985 RepID=UPI00215B30E5|nr:YIP1 family protein [Rossellomorea sp. SC111]MCR8850519.1 YIP1 family protein [Rossellomorea sp. SC111]
MELRHKIPGPSLIFKPKTESGKIADKPTLWRPATLSLIILLAALAIGVLLTDTSTLSFTDENLNSAERVQAFLIGAVAVIALFFVSQSILALYLYLTVKMFRHFSSYRELLSLAFFVSIPISLAELLKIASPLFTAKENISALSSYIGGSPILQGLVAPLEIFNIWSLVILTIGLHQLTKLKTFKVLLIVAGLVIWDSLTSTGTAYITDLFSELK